LRHSQQFSQRKNFLIISIIFSTWILSGWIFIPHLQNNQVIRVEPDSQRIKLGQETNLAVVIDSAANLYGYELHMKFDASVAQIVDYDQDSPGVQVQPGDFFDLDQAFLVINEVDNETGEITYAITLLAPASPISGEGTLIQIILKAVEVGTSAIEFSEVILASPEGQPLPFSSHDGQVIVDSDEIPSPSPTQIPVSSPTTQPSFTETTSPTDLSTQVIAPSPTIPLPIEVGTNTSPPLIGTATQLEGTVIPTEQPSLTDTSSSHGQAGITASAGITPTEEPESSQGDGDTGYANLVVPFLGILIVLGIAILYLYRRYRNVDDFS
jgi:hypothetical protein